MPYLYSDTFGNLYNRTNTRFDTPLERRRDRCAEFSKNLQYCYAGPTSHVSKQMLGVHSSLTLDEYCKPVLHEETLYKRNKDQVLVRYQRSEDREIAKRWAEKPVG